MSTALTAVAQFLIQILFDFYIGLVLLRFFLQWVKADFHNPVCQFISKLTNPLLLPLRHVIPGLFGLDFAALILALICQAVQVALLSLILGFDSTSFFIFLVFIKLASQVLNLYFFIIIARILLSFGTQAQLNPIYLVLIQLSEPILRPIRSILPKISGFDLSPLAALIGIQVILIFIRYLA